MMCESFEDRRPQTLVSVYDSGDVVIATRERSGATWSRPVHTGITAPAIGSEWVTTESHVHGIVREIVLKRNAALVLRLELEDGSTKWTGVSGVTVHPDGRITH